MRRILLLLAALTLFSSAVAQSKTSEYHVQKTSLYDVLPVSSKDIVFLGNSITDGGEWAELFNNRHVKNRGISGDRSGWLLERLDAIIAGHPKKVFLMIGTNDLAAGIPPREVYDNVMKLVERFQKESPWTKLYIQSVLPVNGRSFSKFKAHYKMKDQIVELNTLLRGFCGGNVEDRVAYLDVYAELVDSNGDLNAAYTNDGLHLLGEGYVIWRDAIKNYVK